MRVLSRKIRVFVSLLTLYSICSSAHDTDSKPENLLRKNRKRRLSKNLGLNPSNLRLNEISIGFLPALGELIAPNTPQQINTKLPAPMAIMGDYINLDSSDPNLSGIDAHVKFQKSLNGNPVWEMALMPYKGLELVTQEVANRIASKMSGLNDQGITVWLRFAHEMNGDWYIWGGKPHLFLEKWKMVARAVKSRTSSTSMLWSPNSAFGKVNDIRGGYAKYWPGSKHVDIIGLSFYHYGGYDRSNVMPTAREAQVLIKDFSDLYSKPHNLPVVLSETGASYTRSLSTGQSAPGGASEYSIKLHWLQQLVSKDLRQAVPLFKAFTWFEVKKNENAAGSSPVKSEDFRLVMGDLKMSTDAVAFMAAKVQ
ncbi:hypothetical protein CROQUDRAFT_664478 [Cronartium quercuum f. sp. fusiforme G11]|uniref:GH26 domain-containing protein n=1 Tax=Cronartium quercuum f. sp. fusiforme G11 TaxID=708437 RepID=A0A9P6N6Z5_9BASI|nr:hypothetical protein CROQUDRAFT_664478 [Cronartium quercuum f. sp. fusiforme G11]